MTNSVEPGQPVLHALFRRLYQAVNPDNPSKASNRPPVVFSLHGKRIGIVAYGGPQEVFNDRAACAVTIKKLVCTGGPQVIVGEQRLPEVAFRQGARQILPEILKSAAHAFSIELHLADTDLLCGKIFDDVLASVSKEQLAAVVAQLVSSTASHLPVAVNDPIFVYQRVVNLNKDLDRNQVFYWASNLCERQGANDLLNIAKEEISREATKRRQTCLAGDEKVLDLVYRKVAERKRAPKEAIWAAIFAVGRTSRDPSAGSRESPAYSKAIRFVGAQLCLNPGGVADKVLETLNGAANANTSSSIDLSAQFGRAMWGNSAALITGRILSTKGPTLVALPAAMVPPAIRALEELGLTRDTSLAVSHDSASF